MQYEASLGLARNLDLIHEQWIALGGLNDVINTVCQVGPTRSMALLVLQDSIYKHMWSWREDWLSVTRGQLCPLCYQAGSENASGSAALLPIAGSACLSSGRKPGWRHWFLCPPAQMASGPKHFQTCMRRMWLKSGARRAGTSSQKHR